MKTHSLKSSDEHDERRRLVDQLVRQQRQQWEARAYQTGLQLRALADTVDVHNPHIAGIFAHALASLHDTTETLTDMSRAALYRQFGLSETSDDENVIEGEIVKTPHTDTQADPMEEEHHE